MSSRNFYDDDFDQHPELALQEVASTVDLPPRGPSAAELQQSLNAFLEECEREAAASAEAAKLPFEEPKVDVAENDEVLVFMIDMPGMDEKNVDVWISRDMLTVVGRRPAAGDDMDSWQLRERSRANLRRVLLIPEGIDTNDASMKFHNGVLTVRMAKMARPLSKKRKAARVFAS